MSDQQRKPGKGRKSLFTIAFMFIVTVVFVSALSLIYLLTRDTIRLNESLVLKRAVLYAAGLPIPQSGVEANQLYEDRVREVEDDRGNLRYYEVLSEEGTLQSYVLPVTGAGLWGEIQSVVGVQEDLRTLTGIEFVKQSETPGLGARIDESWFKEQFRGKRWPLSIVPEGSDTGPQEFEAITGATNTTNGVRGILNTRLAEAEEAIRTD